MAVHGRLEGRHRDSIGVQLRFLTLADGFVHCTSAAAGTVAVSQGLMDEATIQCWLLGVQIHGG